MGWLGGFANLAESSEGLVQYRSILPTARGVPQSCGLLWVGTGQTSFSSMFAGVASRHLGYVVRAPYIVHPGCSNGVASRVAQWEVVLDPRPAFCRDSGSWYAGPSL